MNRIDRLMIWRVGSRVGMVVMVFLGIIALVESLDGWRYEFLANNQGQGFALLAIFATAARWSIKVLPVTVLIGAIIALLDMQGHRELMVIKAGGISIWRILRGPILFIVVASLGISLIVDSWVTELNRGILPVPRLTTSTIGGPDQVWLEQESETGRFVIHATRGGRAPHELANATFYLPPGQGISRIEAASATLFFKEWRLKEVSLISSNQRTRYMAEYTVPTLSTRADLNLRLATSDDFTFFELNQALNSGLSDPLAQAAAAMRYAKLLALPALLTGSLLIAFAFTAGYRRTGSYGRAILYGIVLGFVVFVITEMADRAGSAGVLDPTFAAWGPAIVAIVTGVTVLLHKEDGRA